MHPVDSPLQLGDTEKPARSACQAAELCGLCCHSLLLGIMYEHHLLCCRNGEPVGVAFFDVQVSQLGQVSCHVRCQQQQTLSLLG